jgi:FMN phosphatase YigB (HAD superfamily)
LFVGDTVGHDIVGPAAVGIATAWLIADVKPKDDAADYEIAALSEVLAIVDARAA